MPSGICLDVGHISILAWAARMSAWQRFQAHPPLVPFLIGNDVCRGATVVDT
jgi:hypothetical protein